jgi:hypothetical protein
MSDDYDDDEGLGQIGSIYNLSNDKKRPSSRGPRVNMGFHPPEKAWLKPERVRKPRATKRTKRK